MTRPASSPPRSSAAALVTAAAVFVACSAPSDDDDVSQSTTSADDGDDGDDDAASAADDAAPTTGGDASDGPGDTADPPQDDDTADTGEDPGTAHVPDGVLFFDGFDYLVERDADGKFGPDGSFGAHGWSWGKDAVQDGPGAGGWLYTTPDVPGDRVGLPGVDSTHALCVEAKAGTYAGVIEGIWRQTDFYLQYGDVEGGALDTIPADVWIQQWTFVADTPEAPSLFPPTTRLGKWFYPTRNGYPSTDLEWLFGFTGVLLDSEVVDQGSSANIDIGFTSLASHFALTDADGTIFTDGRPDATTTLGHAGTDPGYLTEITANAWWLVRMHVDHTVNPGIVEVWIRPREGEWVKTVDTTTSDVVDWNPQSTEGHRGLRFPTTMSNWYQNPEGQTTHGDWWIYVDDFAIAAGEHAGGGGEADLPQYPW
jgi:hypothetical protein